MTFAFQQHDRKTSTAPEGRETTSARGPRVDSDSLQLAAARPIVFSGTIGLYTAASTHAAPSATAVLFAAPWGLEELSTRKFFRVLADHLSRLGVASLRFDYPGTGDALDPAEDKADLSAWRQSLLDAAKLLGSLGHQRIILIGQSLGGALSLEVSARMENLDGMVLLSPVLSGRAYLRELALWSTVVDDSLKLGDSHRAPAGTVAIAGLTMPAAVASEVAKLKLASSAPALPIDYLLVERLGQLGTDDLSAHVQAQGGRIERKSFNGYEALVAGPTVSRIPQDVLATLVDWIDRRKAPAVASLAAVAAAFQQPAETALVGANFIECPVRFGVNNRLYGVLCEPVGERRGATVVLLGSAYDRHAGWGRLSVLTARQLAASGIASFRFDCANVGDSPAAAGAPSQVLYAPEQQADVVAALDFLGSRSLLPAVAAGRCSGAYLAFRTALKDDRLCGIVAVNPYAFCWDESKPLQEDLRAMPQSLDTYWRKILSGGTFGRIRRGEIDLAGSARNVATTIARKLEYQISSRLGISLARSTERTAVYQAFASLAKRRVDVSLLYSRGDVGLDHLHYHFGEEGSKLQRFSNVGIEFVDADHNLTPQPARATFIDCVRATALKS